MTKRNSLVPFLIALLIAATALPAALGQESAASSAAEQPVRGVSAVQLAGGPPDAAIMVAVAVGVVLVGALICRVLWQLRLIKDVAWVLLIFCALAGAAWSAISVFYDAPENPFRFAELLAIFLLVVVALYAFLRFVLPPEARRTRAAVPPLVRNLAVIVTAFLVLLILIMSIFPGVSLTPVFFTSGVVSIIIGLAVQDVVSNLLAGLVLSLERPYEVGDWVTIAETEGEVTEINWRATRIRDRQGDLVELPNSLIARERLVNHHAPTTLHLRKIHVGVTYDTPPGLATAALLEAAERVPDVRESPAPQVYFRDYQDFALLFELRVWIDNFESVPAIENDVRREIWYAFKRYGITIPFPIRDVNLRQVVEPPMQTHARLIATAGMPRGTLFELDQERTTIGRDPGSAICLSDPGVSNHHAVIERQGDRFILRDLGSRHGTRLNGQAIQSCCLQRGDEIAIGPVTLAFETNLAPIPDGAETRPRMRHRPRSAPPEQPRGDAQEPSKGES